MIHVLVIKRILACNKNTRLCVSKAHKTYKWPKVTKKFASRSVFVYLFVFIKPKEIQNVFFTTNFKVFFAYVCFDKPKIGRKEKFLPNWEGASSHFGCVYPLWWWWRFTCSTVAVEAPWVPPTHHPCHQYKSVSSISRSTEIQKYKTNTSATREIQNKF